MGTKGAWTDERRARQAEIVKQTRPWEHSTGPRTAEGKAVSSQNAQLPPLIREAREIRAAVKKDFLLFSDRERWMRWPKS